MVSIPTQGGVARLDAFTSAMPFGELAFLDRSPRSPDVTALGAVECHVLTRDAFARLDREAPTIKIRLLENLALGLTGMLRQANRELAVLKYASSSDTRFTSSPGRLGSPAAVSIITCSKIAGGGRNLRIGRPNANGTVFQLDSDVICVSCICGRPV
jgi:CRP-like cAMP-binding protein